MHNRILLFLFMCVYYGANCQFLELNSGMDISIVKGDEYVGEWSNDGSKLLCKLEDKSGSAIIIYDFENDTVQWIKRENIQFNNPIWHPSDEKIVFDSDYNGIQHIYSLDLKTNAIKLLFNRNIECKNACFSLSDRQVVFSGYDQINRVWDIYSYDFVYDNLNKLTDLKFGVKDAAVCGDGKLIAFSAYDPFTDSYTIKVINWYGDEDIVSLNTKGEKPKWSPGGLKIYFIMPDSSGTNQLYSVWKNGTHYEQITNFNSNVISSSISRDGKKLALSVETDNGIDVYVFPFELF